MARHHMRRIVALAAAVFLLSTSGAAMASEGPASSAAAAAPAALVDSTASAGSESAKSTSSESESKPTKVESKSDTKATAPASKVAEPTVSEAVTSEAAGPDASPDPATTSAVGDDVASVPVVVPPGLNDGRLFPEMSNTPDGTGVLVGGSFDPGRDDNANDTWVFRDGAWLPVCGTTVPGADTPCALPGRTGGALGTTPGGVIMFGGHPGGLFNPTNPSTSDTWKFDGTSWHQICADGTCGPDARSFAAVAGSAAMSLMFGGLGDNLSTALEDTWAFDGSTWTQLCGVSMGVPCGPSARFWSSMSWDGTHFVLFGGMEGDFSSSIDPVGDTWIWTGTAWQLVCDGVATACGPAPRGHAAFPTLNSPDPSRAGSLLAGGLDLAFGRGGTSTAFRDLWFWSAQDLTWRQLTSPWGPNVTWDGDGAPPADGLPVAFGGAATDDCQAVFYGAVLGADGNGAGNTSTLVGWDNGEGRPATCAEQAVVRTPNRTTNGTAAEFLEADLVGGLPLTGASPWSGVLAGGLLALVGASLVLACRRRSLVAAGV